MRKNFPERKKLRREEAEARQAERDKLTAEQQLAKLEKAGHGHCKETDRLYQQIHRELVAKKGK
jgi:hypothetical protein